MSVEKNKKSSKTPFPSNTGKFEKMKKSELLKEIANLKKRIETLEKDLKNFSDSDLNSSSEWNLNLYERSRDAVVISDLTGNILDANEAALKMTEYREDEIKGMNFTSLIEEDMLELILKTRKEIIETGTQKNISEFILKSKNGKKIWVETTGFLIYKHNKPYAIKSIVRDITKRVEQKKALRESRKRYRQLYKTAKRSEELYRSLLNSSSDAIIIYDMKGYPVFINQTFTDMFGWTIDEIKGKRLDFVPESEKEASMEIVMALINHGTPCQGFETRRYTKSGAIIDVSISGSRYHDHRGNPAGMLAILRDITESKKIKARLQQARKMEAIGTLAGGIAHDFNNILSVIMGNAEIAQRKTAEPDKVMENLKQILKASRRARDLVRQILSFSRQNEPERKPLQFDDTVKEAVQLIRSTLPATIEVRMNIKKGKYTIMADPTQVHQVLINLCANARDAMKEKGGILGISLSHLIPDDSNIKTYPGIQNIPYAKLEVSDTGTGMDRETIERIFDPFFTTKEKGSGTGMGLSVLHGIVESHDGLTFVKSRKGLGTTFEILFPLTESDIIVNRIDPDRIPIGNEHVLFIDDEEMIVDIGRQWLEDIGYTVTASTSAAKGLELFKENPYYYDIVVTDMTMPGMTGIDLAAELFKIRPELPVILCTGFSEKITESIAQSLGIKSLLLKPLEIKTFARALRSALNR